MVGLMVRVKSEERSLASPMAHPRHTLGGPKPLDTKSGEGEQHGKHKLAPPGANFSIVPKDPQSYSSPSTL